jgi:hypothetical protein
MSSLQSIKIFIAYARKDHSFSKDIKNEKTRQRISMHYRVFLIFQAAKQPEPNEIIRAQAANNS